MEVLDTAMDAYEGDSVSDFFSLLRRTATYACAPACATGTFSGPLDRSLTIGPQAITGGAAFWSKNDEAESTMEEALRGMFSLA
jgi:hypothetical protein